MSRSLLLRDAVPEGGCEGCGFAKWWRNLEGLHRDCMVFNHVSAPTNGLRTLQRDIFPCPACHLARHAADEAERAGKAWEWYADHYFDLSRWDDDPEDECDPKGTYYTTLKTGDSAFATPLAAVLAAMDAEAKETP